ncbi:MAG: 16S rRNA (cytosine(1402)-N(4))-methyltransferase RsmH [Anaerolineales bacterium]
MDGTLGAGGHAFGILQASEPASHLLGLDLDPQALAIARERLAPFGTRAVLVQASYADVLPLLDALDWPCVQGIVLDLGVSSMQLDTPERGFSFQADAPLDMRFSPQAALSAADLVNTFSESELADVIFKFGEDRYARRIARAVVAARPVQTTLQLVDIIRKAVPRPAHGDLHPATRTFQALRIAVNRELETIETALPKLLRALSPGGRLAVIAFHSLEDRLVKHFFRREAQDCLCPPRQPICTCNHRASVRELTRRPIMPGEDEINRNPRARSARLRVVEKLPQPEE